MPQIQIDKAKESDINEAIDEKLSLKKRGRPRKSGGNKQKATSSSVNLEKQPIKESKFPGKIICDAQTIPIIHGNEEIRIHLPMEFLVEDEMYLD